MIIGEAVAKAAGIKVTPWAKLRGAMALARGMGAGRGQNAVGMTQQQFVAALVRLAANQAAEGEAVTASLITDSC